MRFKTEHANRLENEWNDARLSPMAKSIVSEAAEYALEKWNWEFVITSIHRTAGEDAALHGSGIHVGWRAVDIRTHDRLQEEIDDVAGFINGKYVYDPARPAKLVCFKEAHGTGAHAHYQVHSNTQLK